MGSDNSAGFIRFFLYFLIPFLSLYLLLSFSNPAEASDSPIEEKKSKDTTLNVDIYGDSIDETGDAYDGSPKKTDTIHAALSNSLSASADWIDSFFREERAEIEEDNSNLRLKLSGLKEMDKKIDFKVKASLHLVLPNLENRLHLFASSILEEDDNGHDYFEPSDEEDNKSKKFYLSMRYFLMSAERMNLSLRAGLKFRKLTPAVFAGPRYSYSKKWDSWDFRFIEDFSYFTDNGWENRSSVFFETFFSEYLFYRINLTGRWQESEPGYDYWVDINLYHTLSGNKVLNYRVKEVFDTYPNNRLTEVIAGVRYRQGFWRKWLFFEISPQVSFAEEDDYHPSPGITISLEMFFGEDFLSNLE